MEWILIFGPFSCWPLVVESTGTSGWCKAKNSPIQLMGLVALSF